MVGKLLVARPSILGDPSFGRSVIVIAEHNDESALGFIVNQPTHYTLSDLLPEFKLDIPVFQGGPVDKDRMFYIHPLKTIPNAKQIGTDLYWGGDLEAIISAINNRELSSNEVKFLLGYTGWGKDQLSQELKENSWLLIKNNYDLFLEETTLWGTILRELGGESALYASAPSHPGLN